MLFSTPVSGTVSKIRINFRPSENMSSLLRLERQQKDFLNFISHISLSLLFIWNWNKEYIHGSLENHTRFQTKLGKVYTRFETKTAQKPHSPFFGVKHIYIAYVRKTPCLKIFFLNIFIAVKQHTHIYNFIYC